VIASAEKKQLIANPPVGKTVSFVLTSNINRPNGGLLERFVGAYIPYLGITFNGATPTDSDKSAPLMTVDIVRQYDGWVDFPLNPLNLLADLNASLGALFLHGDNFNVWGPLQLQGSYQDTAYYLAPSQVLPLLIPLAQIPLIGLPLAKALDPPLRVLVETGYNRTINPGQPTPVDFLYTPNPADTMKDFIVAIPTGWDDAIAQMTGQADNRPFGTAPQPVYGVGGPPVYAGAVDPYRSANSEPLRPVELPQQVVPDPGNSSNTQSKRGTKPRQPGAAVINASQQRPTVRARPYSGTQRGGPRTLQPEPAAAR
jgi:hypothetical protein